MSHDAKPVPLIRKRGEGGNGRKLCILNAAAGETADVVMHPRCQIKAILSVPNREAKRLARLRLFLENTENVVNMGSMFSGCKSLVTLSEIDASSVTSTSKSANYALNNMFDGCSNLVNFGGLRNAKVSFSIANCIRLSHESLMNVINNLALVTNAPTLTLGAENSAKLTEDELQIARNKGWNIALY